jgi:hypothetical protein
MAHHRCRRPRALSPSPRPVAQDEEGVRAAGKDEEEVEPLRRKDHSSRRWLEEGRYRGGRPLSWSKDAWRHIVVEMNQWRRVDEAWLCRGDE